MRVLGVAGIGVCGLALGLAVISTAITYWQTFEMDSVEAHVGLFKSCLVISDQEACTDVFDGLSDEDKNNINGVRACMFLGIILLLAAAALAAIKLAAMPDKQVASFAAGGVAFVAGVVLMAGFALFEAKLKQDTFDHGACFALTIVAWILSWVGGALIIAPEVMKKE